jgi:hypothetical protein
MLLWLYPTSFRSEFFHEMLTTLENGHRERINSGLIPRMLFLLREVAGLLRGAYIEQLSSVRFATKYLVVARPGSGVNDSSNPNEIAELEQRIRFHLSQTVHCIANHGFEGARFHAAEEDRARARLLALQASSGGSAIRNEM